VICLGLLAVSSVTHIVTSPALPGQSSSFRRRVDSRSFFETTQISSRRIYISGRRKCVIGRSAWSIVVAPVGAGVPGVSIVIPAWNEERRLSRSLPVLIAGLESQFQDFELIVVADGCTDSTAEVARRLPGDRVRVLTFAARRGKGGAITEGLKLAKFDRVGFLDADVPIPPSDLRGLVELLASYDVAIATRYASGSRLVRPPTVTRRVLSLCWNLLVRGFLLLPVTDSQCGAKFFRRGAVFAVIDRVSVTGWAFDAELLHELKRSGFSIKEKPVTWTEGGESKLVIVNAIPTMLYSLIRVRLGGNSLRARGRVEDALPEPAKNSEQQGGHLV
jgi:glycosyltransferase involved in cell wall biosynthesis